MMYAPKTATAEDTHEESVSGNASLSIEENFAAQMARRREAVARQQEVPINLDALMAQMRGFLGEPKM